MIGNFVNNTQFAEMVSRGEMLFEPFDPKKLRTIHYALSPEKVMAIEGEDEAGNIGFSVLHDFDVDPEPYSLEPNTYTLIRVREHIKLPKGLIGHFVPSTDMIDRGLIMTAGRIEFPFGDVQDGVQKLHFGVTNASGVNVSVRRNLIVAWIYLVDLRALETLDINITEADLNRIARKVINMSRAMDDGPLYE